MDRTLYVAAAPPEAPRRVLAALGPKMLDLAAEKAAGAHSYFVPVEHTEVARARLGPDPLLAVEQAVVLSTDPTEARAVARQHMAIYLGLPNYTNNLRRLGFDDDDLAGGGSDRLVDAIVGWGTVEDVAARVRSHLETGADHVCLQVLTADPTALPMAEWRELAPVVAEE
jgi:probable F420-dependent oxidoreductase